MPLIRGHAMVGPEARSDLTYAKYGQATWEWWCHRNGVEFYPITEVPRAPASLNLPPTFLRWFAIAHLLRGYSPGIRVAVVDADTMVRWDAPSIFASGGERLAAVRDSGVAWIDRSIAAYQRVFPNVVLSSLQYFNAGVVVLGFFQLAVLHAFLELVRTQWVDLQSIIAGANVGTDQTVLNFVVKREQEPVCFLPRAFNVTHCFPLDSVSSAMEHSAAPDGELFRARVSSGADSFQFLERGYVWHFTNVVRLRALAMQETWQRIRHRYPGAHLVS